MKRHWKTLVLAALTAGLAAGGEARAQWVRFDNNADVRAIARVGGSLWVGTNGGIVLIDPNTNKITGRIAAGRLLPDNSVRVIAEHDGAVYIGTDGGVSVIRGERATVHTEVRGRGLVDVRSIAFGPDGSVLVGTFGRGVARLAPRPSWLTRADSLLDDKVYSILPQDTLLYYATSLGLCTRRRNAWVYFQGGGMPHGEARQVIPVTKNELYVLVSGHGIYRLTNDRAVRLRASDELPGDEIEAVALSPKGELWAIGRFGGIGRYRSGSWTIFGRDDPDVAGARWRSIHVSTEGTVYAGSADGLIASLKADRLGKTQLPSVLPAGFVGAFAEDSAGVTYVAGAGGILSARDDADPFVLEKETGSVLAIAVSPKGIVWAGTPWGLLRRDDGRWSAVRPEIDRPAPVFSALAFDRDGDLWAGAETGELYRYDGQLWIRYADREDPVSGPVRRLVVDAAGDLWMLSGSGGLYRRSGAVWETFDGSRFGNAPIRELSLDRGRNPIVVTDDQLWRFSPASEPPWQVLRLPEAPRVGAFRAVSFDRSGRRVFIGGTDGLAVIESSRVQSFGPGTGLEGREITALLVDRKDRLWIGFRRDGISRISLDKLP